MPSGVGLNLASALTTLGDKVSLLSICGNDTLGSVIKQELKNRNISSKHILSILSQTPQSVVLYDKNGKRQIICDLKDAQETTYNIDIFKTEAKTVIVYASAISIFQEKCSLSQKNSIS